MTWLNRFARTNTKHDPNATSRTETDSCKLLWGILSLSVRRRLAFARQTSQISQPIPQCPQNDVITNDLNILKSAMGRLAADIKFMENDDWIERMKELSECIIAWIAMVKMMRTRLAQYD